MNETKPKSVCHIIFRLDYGGLENGLVNLINNLPRDRYRHQIITLKPATDFRNKIQAEAIRVFHADKRDGIDLSVYARVWKILRKIRPDIIHTRNIPALDLLGPAYLSGCRLLVHSEHGLDISELNGKNSTYNRLRKLSRLVTSRYIAVSKDLESWLVNEIGVPKSKVSRIYNGVDTKLFHPGQTRCDDVPEAIQGSDKFIIGSVGRLAPIKDHVNLTAAFCLLLKRHPKLRKSVRLVIIGDGPTRPECEALLNAMNVQDLAWLPGVRDDVANLYQNFDLFVLPSQREGISNTILEAMSSGLAVVATKRGGTPEIVRDRVTGTLVPGKDSEALAQAIKKYVDDRTLLAKHGELAREHVVSNFSLNQMVSKYDELYKSIGAP